MTNMERAPGENLLRSLGELCPTGFFACLESTAKKLKNTESLYSFWLSIRRKPNQALQEMLQHFVSDGVPENTVSNQDTQITATGLKTFLPLELLIEFPPTWYRPHTTLCPVVRTKILSLLTKFPVLINAGNCRSVKMHLNLDENSIQNLDQERM